MDTKCGNMYKIFTLYTDCMCVLRIQFLTHAPVHTYSMYESLCLQLTAVVEPTYADWWYMCGVGVGVRVRVGVKVGGGVGVGVGVRVGLGLG